MAQSSPTVAEDGRELGAPRYADHRGDSHASTHDAGITAQVGSARPVDEVLPDVLAVVGRWLRPGAGGSEPADPDHHSPGRLLADEPGRSGHPADGGHGRAADG